MRHRSTFRQLEIFEAVARLGSFTRAAEALHLTQPTLSMQIKKLTDIIGAPLFEHIGKKLYLTTDGEELLLATRDIFSTLDRFTMRAADRQGLKKGRLAITAISTASYITPRLLGEFSRQYPGVEVSLKISNREQALDSLAHNLDDLYILGQPPDEVEVIAKAFMCNPLVVLAAPDHPLAGVPNVPLARLAEEPWLLREPGSGTRIAVERLFQEHGVTLRPRMELGSNEALKQAILGGLGISVISNHALALNAANQFAILQAEGFPICRQWYVVYPRGRELSVVARTFFDFLLNHDRRTDACPTF
ncbi:MAG: LysR family transcriptional regulator [Betaproteobacteria bacterium]|nr:LysR family transcriptional regulator [Betaproteobacteria bacterium]